MAIDRRDKVHMLRDENEALKVRNQQINEQLTRHQQAFRALNQMDETMRELSTEFDVEQLINRLLSLALHACNSENGALILVDDETNQLVFSDVIGKARQKLLNHRIDIDVGIVGSVIAKREPMLVTDVRKSLQWSSQVDRVIGFETQALMCAPLYIDDKSYGAIEVINNSSNHDFDDNDLAILRVTARFVSQALQKAEDITLLGAK